MYKACIFDLDGTLTNTLDSLVYSTNETLKEMKLPQISEEQCRIFVGNGARVLIEKALGSSGTENLDRIEEAMQIYGRIFDANCTYHVVPYEGITEMLESMKNRGLKLAVLSNKPHKQAVHVVETIFGKETFQWIQGQIDTVPRKPDPTAVLQIAEKLGATPEETLYIGDSEVDVATGKNAQMHTVGVTWGFRGKEVLEDAGPELIVNSPEEIMNMIED
ncbi:HAD family hydrolase [Mediterraneibacter sp. gm002]|uniref:HAD family hydrolase n=2 Tax=Clostridia TaxID=186801 RepID=UPI000E53E632|nr:MULTISPECIES: HAD-IA family hydrolase [Clostridia]RGH40890.1 HAD family hydrolase [Firmicutes bacterium AM41-5BH]RKQ31068.1 HAD family hydrolase [Ruminococcus sp. B05]TAP34749.1 HAD family hydrolase [Mediterraneibacter sp. gm002]